MYSTLSKTEEVAAQKTKQNQIGGGEGDTINGPIAASGVREVQHTPHKSEINVAS
jgi:hypothetical protein